MACRAYLGHHSACSSQQGQVQPWDGKKHALAPIFYVQLTCVSLPRTQDTRNPGF